MSTTSVDLLAAIAIAPPTPARDLSASEQQFQELLRAPAAETAGSRLQSPTETLPAPSSIQSKSQPTSDEHEDEDAKAITASEPAPSEHDEDDDETDVTDLVADASITAATTTGKVDVAAAESEGVQEEAVVAVEANLTVEESAPTPDTAKRRSAAATFEAEASSDSDLSPGEEVTDESLDATPLALETEEVANAPRDGEAALVAELETAETPKAEEAVGSAADETADGTIAEVDSAVVVQTLSPDEARRTAKVKTNSQTEPLAAGEAGKTRGKHESKPTTTPDEIPVVSDKHAARQAAQQAKTGEVEAPKKPERTEKRAREVKNWTQKILQRIAEADAVAPTTSPEAASETPPTPTVAAPQPETPPATPNTTPGPTADAAKSSAEASPTPIVGHKTEAADRLGQLTQRHNVNGRHAPELTNSQQMRLVQRVARAFDIARARGDEAIRLKLSPPQLGSLRLELQVEQGAMTARLEVESVAARDALVDNLGALKQRLAEQNIRVERFDVDLADRRGNSPNQQQQQTPFQHNDHAWRRPGQPASVPTQSSGPAKAATVSRTTNDGSLDVII